MTPTTPADASPAAGEVVALDTGWFSRLVAASRHVNLRDFALITGVSRATLSRIERGHAADLATARVLGPIVHRCACCGQAWPLTDPRIETDRAFSKGYLSRDREVDASRAETDAAKRERDNFRDGYRALGGLKYEVEIKLDAANALADRLARDLREMSVARAEVEKAMFARHNDCLAAESKLAETAAELVRVRAKLAKIAEFVKGRQHDDDAWGHGAAAEDETILAEIEEGKSP